MPSGSKILIIDEDGSTRETLTHYLETQGFSVRATARQTQALKHIKSFSPALIILDIALGNGGGLALFLKLRKLSEAPVIFLARDAGEAEESDCIISLEIGGDDYITLPCNPRELTARIKAVLRRVRNTPETTKPMASINGHITFGGCTFNPVTYKLTNQTGRAVRLSRNERKLLTAFLANPNTVLSREKLLGEIQSRPKDIFDRSIDNLVSRLRKKLEANPEAPRLIKTYWGGGYSLTAEVSTE